MSNNHANHGTTTLDPSFASSTKQTAGELVSQPGFFRRHRLSLFLGLLAICLYVGSLVYIVYFRGQVG